MLTNSFNLYVTPVVRVGFSPILQKKEDRHRRMIQLHKGHQAVKYGDLDEASNSGTDLLEAVFLTDLQYCICFYSLYVQPNLC